MRYLKNTLIINTLILTPALFSFTTNSFAVTEPTEGIRNNIPQISALTNCKIHSTPEKIINSGSIVIRNGLIENIGKNISIPSDAYIWDCNGKSIYPGFIEPYYKIKTDIPKTELNHWNNRVHPEFNVIEAYKPDKDKIKELNKLGFTSALLVPQDGIFKGKSTLISLIDNKTNEIVIKPNIASHIEFERSSWTEDTYPNSLMGSIALIRQTFMDTEWYSKANKAYTLNPSQTPPEVNKALNALKSSSNGDLPTVFEVKDDLDLLRASQIHKEFGLKTIIKGSGYEYRIKDEIKNLKFPIILPVNFPDKLDVENPVNALGVSLEELQHWDIAPENPKKLYDSKIPYTFTSSDLKDKDKFLDNIRKSIKRGLPEKVALAALTVQPSKIFGVDKKLGTIEKGKLAHLVITDGNIFSDETKILDVWVDGKRNELEKEAEYKLKGEWNINSSLKELEKSEFEIDGNNDDLSITLKSNEKEITLKEVNLTYQRLSAIFDAKDIGINGFVRLNAKISKDLISGNGILPNGDIFTWNASKTSKKDKEESKKEDIQNEKNSNVKISSPPGAFSHISNNSTNSILIKNGIIWTSSNRGILSGYDILINKGKIEKIAKNITVSGNTLIIDAKGKHITPGLIDAHSHTGIARGINESTQSSTAEVRIGDVIDSYDIGFYRELAGGLTVASLLHGSANSIGGQNQVIKLRWGSLPEEMKFENALPGVKFALGENVKQSNWGDDYTTRYPQTRMGVEQFMRDRFNAALDYKKSFQKYNSLSQNDKEITVPPRKDLELDALLEIIEGKRIIHSHSYRQDEILMLVRIADDFGFKVGTFQHVLEGYKVAEALEKHGAGASTFADWWGYKFEVYDAIPYNGALMSNAGVLVSFNSDSDELARRMNLEAAKAIKYGGLSPEEALKLVTINPAKQLRIDKRVGSIEEGKDGDFVIWSSSPLSTYTVCEQTWIDGKKYFDIKDDINMRKQIEKERELLIQKYLESKHGSKDNDSNKEEK